MLTFFLKNCILIFKWVFLFKPYKILNYLTDIQYIIRFYQERTNIRSDIVTDSGLASFPYPKQIHRLGHLIFAYLLFQISQFIFKLEKILMCSFSMSSWIYPCCYLFCAMRNRFLTHPNIFFSHAFPFFSSK